MTAPAQFEIQSTHAVYRPTGEVTLEQAVAMIVEAIHYARAQNLRRLLAVITGLGGFAAPSVTARYYLIRSWAEAAGGVVRIALVLSPQLIDPERFGLTVAANSGLIANVFTEEDEALRWLLAVS